MQCDHAGSDHTQGGGAIATTAGLPSELGQLEEPCWLESTLRTCHSQAWEWSGSPLFPSVAPPLYHGRLKLLSRGPGTPEILTGSRRLLLTHSSSFPTASGTFSGAYPGDAVAIVTSLLSLAGKW